MRGILLYSAPGHKVCAPFASCTRRKPTAVAPRPFADLRISSAEAARGVVDYDFATLALRFSGRGLRRSQRVANPAGRMSPKSQSSGCSSRAEGHPSRREGDCRRVAHRVCLPVRGAPAVARVDGIGVLRAARGIFRPMWRESRAARRNGTEGIGGRSFLWSPRSSSSP